MKRNKNNLEKCRLIIKAIVFIIIFIYFSFKFFSNSLFQVGSVLFENNGKLKLICMITITVLIYIIYLIYKKIKIKFLDINYIREIPNHYSLFAVSFLYNKQIKIKPLLMATILKFSDLELIKISIKNDKVIYEKNEEKNIDKISESEKYILSWLISENKNKYSLNYLNSLITRELEQAGLIKNKSLKPIVLIILILSIFPILQIQGYISYDVYGYVVDFGMILFGAFSIKSIFKPTIKKDFSKKGKIEHYNVLGFYKFLKDFTLLSEKQMEEYILWKDYLQFAVMFNINKNYVLKEKLNFMTTEELLNLLEELEKE